MPEIGGAEVFRQIREISPAIRVLLVSGYAIDGQVQQILETGCNGFIQKPFSLKEISHKIREIFKQ
jgi:CheY-like chemotaxis protein